MKLLQVSLQSTNITAYMAASFIKRLCTLALSVPTPASQFCIAQATWLLRRHPGSHVLLHARPKGSLSPKANTKAKEVSPDADSGAEAEWNAFEEQLEKTGALGNRSSLWEVALLKHHHYHATASLAAALRKSGSTASEALAGKPGLSEDEKPFPMHVPDFFAPSYASLMAEELTGTRKGLSHVAPTVLHRPHEHQTNGVVQSCFGGF